MIAGELLIKLGIVGADKAKSATDQLRGSLAGISTTGLAAGAAIAGMAYSLKNIAGHAMDAGTNLMQYNKLTGESTDQLQKWRYAARQAGVSNEELDDTIMGIQKKMAEIQRTGAVPEGMSLLQSVIPDFDPDRIDDVKYMFENIVKLSRMQGEGPGKIPIGYLNDMVESLGFGKSMTAAAREGVFTQSVYNKAPLRSQGQIEAGQKIRNLVGNLEEKFQFKVDELVTKHGEQIAKDIAIIANEILRIAELVTVVAENTGFLNMISEALKGIADLFGVFNGKTATPSAKVQNDPLFKMARGLADYAGDYVQNLKVHAAEAKRTGAGTGEALIGALPSHAIPHHTQNTTVNVQQNIHGAPHPEKLAKEIAHHVDKHVKQKVGKARSAQHSPGRAN